LAGLAATYFPKP